MKQWSITETELYDLFEAAKSDPRFANLHEREIAITLALLLKQIDAIDSRKKGRGNEHKNSTNEYSFPQTQGLTRVIERTINYVKNATEEDVRSVLHANTQDEWLCKHLNFKTEVDGKYHPNILRERIQNAIVATQETLESMKQEKTLEECERLLLKTREQYVALVAESEERACAAENAQLLTDLKKIIIAIEEYLVYAKAALLRFLATQEGSTQLLENILRLPYLKFLHIVKQTERKKKNRMRDLLDKVLKLLFTVLDRIPIKMYEKENEQTTIESILKSRLIVVGPKHVIIKSESYDDLPVT